MVEAGKIMVCKGCLKPLGCLKTCPKCNSKAQSVPMLLLRALRILRAKGWVVEKWAVEISIPPDKEQFTIRLWFYLFAPPTHYAEYGIGPVFDNGKPSYIVTGKNYIDGYNCLSRWVYGLENFAIPFGQGLCDKCMSQGADWYFCRVNCPVIEPKGRKSREFVRLCEGLPDRCINLVLQTITVPDRYNELESCGYFNKNPIARRICRQWRGTK